MSSIRPRRSVLYLPASNERALEKAKQLPVDALVLDLEDAVTPDRKAAARELACSAAVSGAYGMRELTIRINGLGSPWHEADLAAASAAGPDGIVVPKVGTAEEVRSLAAAMEAAEAPERTALWAMVETPRAILSCEEIGSASSRLTVFVLGTNDLVKELGTLSVAGRGPIHTALSLAVLGARAAGVTVLDGVYNDVRDPAGFEEECRQGRELGFDGKTLIHPGQVEIANRVFAPSDEEIETARRTIAAFETARTEGRGVATLDGRLVESLHVDVAQRTLALAEAIAARG
ncbi:MAG TPA: CoA ester lyase [Lapillicoccus sp.]